ncbi:hypothetical protein EON80_06345 [bacterium]|nr:MAG: hypothetical protein EON80_06345 [bacterium]
MNTKWKLMVLTAVLVAIGTGVGVSARGWYVPWMSQRMVLEGSDKFVLVSLHPQAVPEGVKTQGDFYGFAMLGQKQITDPKLKARLVKALYEGLEVPEDYAAGDCFFPSYGIRATRAGRTVDVALCYDCGGVEFYEGREEEHVPTLREPRAVFEKAVVAAKLPRAADVGWVE